MMMPYYQVPPVDTVAALEVLHVNFFDKDTSAVELIINIPEASEAHGTGVFSEGYELSHEEVNVIESSVREMKEGRVRDLPDNWADSILKQLSDELDDDF